MLILPHANPNKLINRYENKLITIICNNVCAINVLFRVLSKLSFLKKKLANKGKPGERSASAFGMVVGSFNVFCLEKHDVHQYF